VTIKVREVRDLPDGTYATVYEEGEFRIMAISDDLTNEGLIQGRQNLKTESQLESAYMSSMLLGLTQEAYQRVAILGLGAGRIPHFIRKTYPYATIIIVEHFQEIVDLAKKYFVLENPGKYVFCVQHYLNWLNRTTYNRLDLLIIDIFTNRLLIEDMANSEFYQLCRSRLKRDGVLAANLVGEPDQINRCFEAVHARFECVYRTAIPGKPNVILTASDTPINGFERQSFKSPLRLIPHETLETFYLTAEQYVNMIGVRPDDDDPELQRLWDAFYACDEYIRGPMTLPVLIKDPYKALSYTAEILSKLKHDYTWIIPQSGGKDSRSVVWAVLILLKENRIPRPKRLVTYFCDTLMEYPSFKSQAAQAIEEFVEYARGSLGLDGELRGLSRDCTSGTLAKKHDQRYLGVSSISPPHDEGDRGADGHGDSYRPDGTRTSGHFRC